MTVPNYNLVQHAITNLFDATHPTTNAPGDAADEGTATIAARRDHQHANPATWPATAHPILSAAHTDTTPAALVRGDLLVAIGASPLLTRYAWTAPAANLMNVFGGVNGELEPTWKALLDATNPATLTVTAAAAAGTATVAAHRDHVHPITSSSNPGAAASLLATDASGYSALVRLGLGGVTAPSYSLHTGGNMAFSGQNQEEIQFRSLTNTDGYLIGRSFAADNANDLYVYDLAAYKFILGARGGNVYVGASSGTYRLHVTCDGDPYYQIGLTSYAATTIMGMANAGPFIISRSGAAYDFTILDSGKFGIKTNTQDAQMAINGGLNVGADADPGDNNLSVAGNAYVGMVTGTARLHLPAGSATASTAPLKLTSGTLLTTPEAGAVEFLTDDFWATITTGAARKGVVLTDGTNLTSGRVPFATTNGRLVDDADLTFAADTLSATKVSASGGVTTQAVDFVASTPDALAGDVNNWDLGNNTFIRATGGAGDRIITGIAARASGHLLIIQNIGTTNKLTFSNESASSSAANRLINGNAGSVEITPNHTIMYIYDATTARWREVTHLL
jgi:hypothetical protein